MIIVTGGAGFIGSNIVKALNRKGRSDILVVDDLTDGQKFKNLVDCDIADYMDSVLFLEKIQHSPDPFDFIDVIFHEGACSTTTEWNGRYMMENNYRYSKQLLHYCLNRRTPFIYASSAAVYGNGRVFVEDRANESPINVYGYSKFLFDQYVRNILKTAGSPVVGMRYFNVYGPGEFHKGSMASVAFHLQNQIKETDNLKLFEGSDGFGPGEQRRDFVYVDDVVATNLWFFEHLSTSGIFNVGTGKSQTFNEVAEAVKTWYGRGKISYIPFPEKLKGHYQSFTEADLTKLRATGCDIHFRGVSEGVAAYLDWLKQQNA